MLICTLKRTGSFSNLRQFSNFYNKDTHLSLWKYEAIDCFCQSAKQPSTPLEWYKCLDHGWVHAQNCAHDKHIDGYSKSKVHFYL